MGTSELTLNSNSRRSNRSLPERMDEKINPEGGEDTEETENMGEGSEWGCVDTSKGTAYSQEVPPAP
jgi:hypothetical protein